MAVAVRRETGMSVAEYRTWVADRPDDERWKLLDGEPELMSPPNARHQRIVMKLGRHLDRLAERRGRNALPGLGVLSAAMDDVGPIPDVVVICGPLPPDGYTHDPVLVAEVLSPSTMTDDLGRNTGFHRSVQSLRTFLIVDQDQPRVELWSRGDGWSMHGLGLGGVIELPELGGSLAVGDIYARVTF
ncbi:hypothetical protein ASG40_04855 [Methylobacterium sp. Leaf399]|uniref:Uma2 family endonuclease n=1 Tax=Methylobacterium sp. Leaf399 TaxID=1736364 RepID=UPI0006F60541|nr:Uma2 family endonuclease [Methylobacterium sp. Leaf399]KQT14649.1 hypothetical protein ASG40_04855 [Methylobacterium sp. Leaf399]